MACFTQLNQKQFKAVAAAFGLEAGAQFSPVADGSVNSIYRVESSGSIFYLRIEEVKPIEDLEIELEYVRRIAERGFPCPTPLAHRDAAAPHPHIFLLDGKPLTLFPKCPGSPLALEAYGKSHYTQVGALLADLHTAGEDFSKNPDCRFLPEGIARIFKAARPRVDSRHKNDLDEIQREIDQQNQWAENRQGLPKSITHGDVFADNIFFEKKQLVGLIDYDAACRRECLFDLATAFNALCYRKDQFSFPDMAALLKGYQAKRKLSEDEKSEIVSVWRLSSLRFTVTRIQDFHLRQDPSSGLIQRDFRDFFKRLEFQRRLTSEQFWKEIS